ncbi:MAG: cupin [Chloroflexota bacterium]
MNENIIHVQKWSSLERPSEEKLWTVAGGGVGTVSLEAGPGDVYHAQTLSHGRVVYVVSGSITFGFPIEAAPTTLRAGDRLDLPPKVPHNAAVGFDGVVCLEAARH